MRNDEMRKIVATGYELELLNTMIERVSELYEFPDSTKAALAAASNSIQEQAVDLDTIDSLQTDNGPLRRAFQVEELEAMYQLVVDALNGPVTLVHKNLLELRKMLEHPDHSEGE